MLPVEPQPAEPLPPPSKTPVERRQSLRFVWQMDANGRLTIGTEEFATAIGPQAAATLSRPWREIATDLNLDTNGQIERAIASRDTWSNITVAFPVDDAEQRLPVELSGLPVFDRERNLLGYRGFGVCRDAAMLATMVGERNRNAAATQPNSETPKSEVPTADTAKPEQSQPRPEPPGVPRGTPCPVRGAADRERLAVPLLGAGREIAKPDAGRTQDFQRARQHAVGAAARSAQSRQQIPYSPNPKNPRRRSRQFAHRSPDRPNCQPPPRPAATSARSSTACRSACWSTGSTG